MNKTRVACAAMQADKCLAAGDLDGKAVWMGVIGTIKEVLDQQPPSSDTPPCHYLKNTKARLKAAPSGAAFCLRGLFVDRDVLLDVIWGYSVAVETHTLETHNVTVQRVLTV